MQRNAIEKLLQTRGTTKVEENQNGLERDSSKQQKACAIKTLNNTYVQLIQTQMCITQIAFDFGTSSDVIWNCSWDDISLGNSSLDSNEFQATNCTKHESDHWFHMELDANNQYHPIKYEWNENIVDDAYYGQHDFPNELWIVSPSWEIAAKTLAFLPVIVGGILGNFALLHAMFRFKPLRTPTNMMIANMAFADLLTLLVSPVMLLMHDFFQNYMLGAFGCKFEGFIDATLLISGVLNLCAVSYDRLTAIVLPQETRLTKRGVRYVMAATWLIGFLVATPLAVFRIYKERQWKNVLETYCKEDRTFLPIYWHVIIAALVWLPLGVMLICYVAIFLKLDRYESMVLRREHPITVRHKTRVAKMLFIVVIVFVICHFPFTALVFYRSQKLKSDSQMNQVDASFQILWFSSHYLVFLNAALNPIIYGLTNENFRKAFRQSALCKCFFSAPSEKPKVRSPYRFFFGRGVLQPRLDLIKDEKAPQNSFKFLENADSDPKSKKSYTQNDGLDSSKLTPLPITEGFI
ncbi:substance-K receptor-like [Ctenocephalides felis]|uniref:substance-K receptor-like n=1 Tax=Ctenocephalides felis TaxID=7515 RepID=UPI000E6E1EC3|nr:substance-K receptor-like [Ctenocephalides felis]